MSSHLVGMLRGVGISRPLDCFLANDLVSLKTLSRLRSRHKGIVLLLKANRCGWPMTGKDERVIRQCIELGSDGGSKLLEAAIGKICSPNTAMEQYIPPKNNPRRSAFPNENDVTYRMSGCVVDLQVNSGR